uniref:Peptidase S8/S53 domain-containing protein n=1 Tax=Oryza glumipatula TaxID=40148 RepID=A0A0E0AU48_9ORYZ
MDVASGHGTHMASIAAGSFVNNVSVNGGLANGTASGMAPWAHVAIYKVCDYRACSDDAVIHAMDEAVHDDVDVISFSISQEVKTTYDRDVVAIAAYSAMEKGIPFVVCAGNQGPGASTVENDVPWMFTVGAGTVDRSMEAKLQSTTGGNPILGQYMTNRKRTQVAAGWYPVLYGEDGECRYCLSRKWKSRRFFATRWGGNPIAEAVTKYKAAAAVSIQQPGYTFDLYDYGPARPIVQVSYDERERLKGYASSPAVMASLELGDTVLGSSIPAPIVAGFSGRGPSKRSPGILKLDIMAPGVNIFAGVPDAHPYTPFDFMSGTSMATPHVSGLVALFRTLQPHWSPAAIRSAFVTTADVDT